MLLREIFFYASDVTSDQSVNISEDIESTAMKSCGRNVILKNCTRIPTLSVVSTVFKLFLELRIASSSCRNVDSDSFASIDDSTVYWFNSLRKNWQVK